MAISVAETALSNNDALALFTENSDEDSPAFDRNTHSHATAQALADRRDIYLAAGLSIKPKTRLTKIDALKEIIRVQITSTKSPGFDVLHLPEDLFHSYLREGQEKIIAHK
jgi:hypothetical protein